MTLQRTLGVFAVAAVFAAATASGCGSDSGGTTSKHDAGADHASDAPDGDGGPLTNPYSACSPDGWCWDVPKPQGNALRGAWSSGANDVWAVGDHGTVIHWDGKGWAGLDAGTTENLNAVWGSSGSDVWAVGDSGTLDHYDGKKWSLTLLASDAGTEAGTISTDFFGVSGTGAKDVWAVGEGGAIYHFSGSTWSSTTSPVTSTLRAVWARSDGYAWATGDAGVVLGFDGTDWKGLGNLPTTGRAVHGYASEYVVIVGDGGKAYTSTDGVGWTTSSLAATSTLFAVYAESSERIWAFGGNGETWRYSAIDTTWTKLSGATMLDLFAATPSDAKSLLVVGAAGVMEKWQGDARGLISSGSAANRLALTGSGADDVWAVGDEVLHREAGQWGVVDPKSDRALYDGFAAAKDDLWVVGTGGTVLRYRGSQKGFSSVDTTTQEWLRGIWVTPTGGWIVGTKGTTLALLNQTSWVATPSNSSADLNDVWVASATDAWAVGDVGTILHWDGTAWGAYPVSGEAGTSASFRSVWGSSANDVWAVGTNATIARYDGKVWEVTATGETYSLNDVWGSSASDVYAVGTGGKILHFDGKKFSEQDSGTSDNLNAVWGADATHVWVAGEQGAILIRTQ